MKTKMLSFLLPIIIFSQQPPLNQMEQFIASTGPVVNFENYYLPGLKSANGKFIYAKLRKIVSGQKTQFFLLLSAKDKNSSNSAVLSETDLKQILNNLLTLQKNVNSGADQSDYRESKYITADWFQVGCAYNAYEKKIIWSITLERNDDATFFFHSPAAIEQNLTAAVSLIDELNQKPHSN